MDITDCNSQLEFLHSHGKNLNKTYSELFGISNICDPDEAFDTFLTPMQWACTRGDIGLLKKLIIYHLALTNSSSFENSDPDSYPDNLAISLIICVQEKQGECFKFLLKVGASPLRRVNICGNETTAFQEACNCHTGWYLVHFFRRGYCSNTALIDIVSTPDSSFATEKTIKLKKSYFNNFSFEPSYRAMIENCTPEKIMDACHWSNVSYVVGNIDGCKELASQQLAKCKWLINQPRNGELRYKNRGEILNKIDALTDYLSLDQVSI